jgi:hypothetical protein
MIWTMSKKGFAFVETTISKKFLLLEIFCFVTKENINSFRTVAQPINEMSLRFYI